MIIKIEDAPAVKHITIDIDFTGDGEAVTTIVKDTKKSALTGLAPRDESLDLDENFDLSTEEEVIRPAIQEEAREAKVSDEMQNMEI